MHTTEIVPVERVGNLLADVERLYDAIAAKANQYSDDRGSVEGYHVDDWLRAESELVVKPKYKLIREKHNFTVEMALPETETLSLAIRVTPTGMLITSKPDDNGRQVFQIIGFPEPIDWGSLHTEMKNRLLRVSAKAAENPADANKKFTTA
jgi:HSP20 family molecular chaperone IbpA